MFPFQKILVPIDFDASSEKALATALALAPKDGKVVLFHVVELPSFAYSGSAAVVSDLLGQLERDAQAALEKVVARAKETFPNVEGMLRSGSPAPEIQEAIKQVEPDLVVMGTHGRKLVDRVLLGSVAEKTVRLSKVPVMTVRIES